VEHYYGEEKKKIEHYYSYDKPKDQTEKRSESKVKKQNDDQLPEHVDYFISTIPLDNIYKVLKVSNMLDVFPKVKVLRESQYFTKPVGTVNLQAWFAPGRRVIPTEYRNVIAGFEPLCVLVDYKDILPTYKKDDN